MPHIVQFQQPIAGFMVNTVAPGESGLMQVLGLRTSDEGALFTRMLEGCQPFFAGGPQIEPSQIDHFLFVIERSGKATVYVNELQTKAKIQVKAKDEPIKAGDPVMVNDIADIVEVDLGVEIPADAGVAYMFSFGWRKALFFDFRQTGPSPVPRTYNLPAVLAGCRCALMFSERFSLGDAEWKRLLDQQWFPFVGLSLATLNEIIVYARQDWDLAKLESRIMQECKDLALSFAASCETAPLFQPHAEAIATAARHFVADEWFSAASILYPRIEGILRTYYASIGATNSPTQDRFLAAAHSGSGVGRHGYCLLLLDRFDTYLRQVIFAPFDHTKPAGVSRHTLAHGVVDPAECDGKSVTIAMLSLHHLFYSLTAGVKPTVKVFQYGSNCSASEINNDDRLCGDAKFVDIARTEGDFELAFDVHSKKRGCAASDIVESPGQKVWGVLYEVPEYLMSKDTASAQSRKSFDEIEGPKYRRETIIVRRPNGEAVEAITYRVIAPQKGLKTNLVYVQHIIAGLREHGVDAGYVARVQEIAIQNNPDIAEGVKAL